jgi:hypothetical protein
MPVQELHRTSAANQQYEEQMIDSNTAFMIINTITCSLGFIACVLLIAYSRWRPQYFNKAVGRVLLSLAVADMLYALARVLPYEGDNVLICKLQGTLLLTAAVSGILLIGALSVAVLRIVVYHQMSEIWWAVIASIFISPVICLSLFMFLVPSAYNDDDQDGLCTNADLTLFHFLRAIEAVFVTLSVIAYGICIVYIYREKKRLKNERSEILIYRNMTMRLCFAYILASLLSILPEWLISYNVHAKTINSFSRIMRMITKGLFGGGRGLVHSLCFVLVFHGDAIFTRFKRSALWLFSRRARRRQAGDSDTGESSTVLVEECTVKSLDYEIDDLHKKTFDVGIISSPLFDHDIESQLSIPPPAKIAKS